MVAPLRDDRLLGKRPGVLADAFAASPSDHASVNTAASVREGLDETLALRGLGVEGTLYRKLRSTNAIENLNSGIATYARNVKRWQGGFAAGLHARFSTDC